MGNSAHIDYDRYPKQGEYNGKSVRVCFHYDLSRTIKGTLIRDDMEGDFLTVIQLEDGRVVLGSECQYSRES